MMQDAVKARLRMPKDKFLARRVGPAEKTDGGLEIPKTAQEKIPHATVVVAGESEKLGVNVEEGDMLVFPSWGGTAVKIEGEMMLILGLDDILLVIKNDA